MLNRIYLKPFDCIQKKSLDTFKNVINKMCLQIIYLIYSYKEDLALNNLQLLIYQTTKPNKYLVYMYKEDLVLSNLQWLMCHKTQPKPNHIYLIHMYKEDLALNNLQWLVYHTTYPPKSSLKTHNTPSWDKLFYLL